MVVQPIMVSIRWRMVRMRWEREWGMARRLWEVAAGVVGCVIVGATLVSSATAGETALTPDEAKRFVANKFFSYTCFDGTNGAGRIQADGSVIGTMQSGAGPVRFVSLPSGTIKLGSD